MPSDAVIDSLNIPTGFARFLRDRLDVPVGIIHVAVSGTNQGAWMRRETLERFPGQGKHANYYQELFASHNADLAKKGKDIKSWDEFEQAMAVWRSNPKGRSPADMAIMNFPTTLYNTRIHPLAPFALRGVIWHQGEGGPGGPYGRRLVAMAGQWCKQFGQDFYFIWGTLTRNTKASPPIEPQPTWFYRSATNGEIRKAVEYFGDDGRAALVELYDVGDHETHFLQKAEASRRMGLAALTLAYGQPRTYCGPLKTDLMIESGKAIVRFDRVGDGLVYKPSIDGISGVYVKGEDKKKLYEQLMGEPYPGDDALTVKQELVYSCKALDRCWKTIRQAAKEANPDCIVWITSNRMDHPHVVDSDMYRQADWLMNEVGDMERIAKVKDMVGENTRLITCMAA